MNPPLGRYARYAHVFFNPQSLRDSPVGHWEPDSPDPLGRYAPSGVITSG